MIERRRKRPRVRSVSFRTFWWLVTAVATFCICRPYVGPTEIMRARAAWLALSTQERQRHARRILAHFPERSFYPWTT